MTILTWLFAAAASAGEPDGPQGAVGGRLFLQDGKDTLTIEQAERELGGEPISLELRNGPYVYEAQLSGDGAFVVEGPPGDYRLEYIRVGDRAEFIPPQEFKLRANALTCAGTITLDTGTLENLGANQKSAVKVTDDCDKLLSRLQLLAKDQPGTEKSLARTGRVLDHVEGNSWLDHAANLRLELSATSGPPPLGIAPSFRATYLHELPLRWNPYLAATFYASFGHQMEDLSDPILGAFGKELLGGVGLNFAGWDLVGFGGLRLAAPPIGPYTVVGAMGRVSFGFIGLGMRMEVVPWLMWTFTVDFSPVAFLGGLT